MNKGKKGWKVAWVMTAHKKSSCDFFTALMHSKAEKWEEKSDSISLVSRWTLWKRIREDAGSRKWSPLLLNLGDSFPRSRACWAHRPVLAGQAHATLISCWLTKEPSRLQHHLPGCLTFTCSPFRTTGYAKFFWNKRKSAFMGEEKVSDKFSTKLHVGNV